MPFVGARGRRRVDGAIYIYIYIYIYIHMIHIYIYIYIHTYLSLATEGAGLHLHRQSGLYVGHLRRLARVAPMQLQLHLAILSYDILVLSYDITISQLVECTLYYNIV